MTHYRIAIYKVMLVRDGSVSVPAGEVGKARRVMHPQQAAAIIRPYLAGADREHFVVLMLDTKNHVLGINTVSVGALDRTVVHPREVFKPAILANAAGIILAHNHPSGDPTPSRDDIDLTHRLAKAGEILGIPVMDHVIVTEGPEWVSFRDEGHL